MATLQVKFEKLLAAVKDLFQKNDTRQDMRSSDAAIDFAEFLNSTMRDIAIFDTKHETVFSKNTSRKIEELTGDEMDLAMKGSPLQALEDAKKSIEKLDYLATPLEKFQIMQIELGQYVEIGDLHSIEDLCSTGIERLSVYHVGDFDRELYRTIHCLGNGQKISDMYPDYGLIADTELSQYCMDNLQRWMNYERNNSTSDDAHRWRSSLNTKQQTFVNRLEDKVDKKQHKTTIKKPTISDRLQDAAVKCASNRPQKEESLSTHEAHHRSR